MCEKKTPWRGGVRPAGEYANSAENSLFQNNVKCKPCEDKSCFPVANASYSQIISCLATNFLAGPVTTGQRVMGLN